VIRVGIAGIGFMGMIHYHAIKRLRNARVVSICTRDPKKLQGDWRSIQGNFGPRGAIENLKNIRTYDNFDAMLADPNVDLIDICLPTHMHPQASIAALKQGKHVLVEKPIALRLDDGRRMMAAARKAKRKLFVAHVLPFFPGFSDAIECVRSGKLGKLQVVRLNRIIAKPDWRKGPQAEDLEGGAAIDLHIHDTHFIQMLCGTPKAVFSRGITVNGTVNYLSTQYIYKDPNLNVSCDSGAVSMKGRSFTHGFELYFEKGTLLYQWASMSGKAVAVTPLTLLDAQGKVRHIGAGISDPMDAFIGEIKTAVDTLSGKSDGKLIGGEGALSALAICYREIESVRSGKIMPV
jgi:predicted dehydrogenase